MVNFPFIYHFSSIFPWFSIYWPFIFIYFWNQLSQTIYWNHLLAIFRDKWFKMAISFHWFTIYFKKWHWNWTSFAKFTIFLPFFFKTIFSIEMVIWRSLICWNSLCVVYVLIDSYTYSVETQSINSLKLHAFPWSHNERN